MSGHGHVCHREGAPYEKLSGKGQIENSKDVTLHPCNL